MPPILLYLLKVSISLSVVWLFYQLLLRRLTFYGLNRWYLLGYSVLSFFIPLINIYPILQDAGLVGEPYLIQFIPAVGGEGGVIAPEVHRGISGWTWLIGAIVLGALVLMVRLAIRGLSLYRLRKSARLIEGMSLKIYQVDASIIPFSFGHSIYINQHLHTEQQWSDIILHEYVHIRQRHTVDILLTELICMLNWYNPFSWLMRWSIRQNLEFIADQQVLENGVDRKGYQYHLLTVLGEPRYRLANSFNFSSLKKRIVMMNKIRSARLHLLKFLFVLPLVGVLLVAFRDKYTGLWRPAAGQVYVNVAGIVFDLSSKDPLAGVTVRDSISGLQATTDDRGFYKLHIPVAHDPIKIGLTFKKADYDNERAGQYIPTLKNTIGIIENMFLSNPGYHYKGVFGMFPPQGHIPEDPDYADATAALRDARKWNDDYAQYLEAQKQHGITLLGAKKDTVPASNTRKAPTNMLYVLNGERMPAGWTADMLPADSIGTKVVMEAAMALTFFGPRGVNGAVVIRTKAYEAAHPFMGFGDDKRGNPAVLSGDSVLGRRVPLWVVDGQIWPSDSLKTLDPGRIESITVLKSEENTKQYGEQGKNGVIVIKLKPKGTYAVPYKAGSMTINGNSHVEGNGQAIGVANGPREGQAQVIFDNGKQIAIADTVKMNGIIITTYHPGGNQ